MPGSTTIAEMLDQVFGKLEQSMPTGPSIREVTLLEAWTAVLGGPDRSSLEVVTSIAQLYALVTKLRAQIGASVRLSDLQKRAALKMLSGFEPLFDVAKFHRPAWDFRKYCDDIQRSHLGLIGQTLEPEFKEPRLDKPDAEELKAALIEVRKLLADSDIALDLRVSLTKQIDVMIW